MSILSSFLVDVKSLIFPPICPVCKVVIKDDDWLCTMCRMTVPTTGFWREVDNQLTQRFWGVIPIVNASSFIYFVDNSGWRNLIHNFKYRGAWGQAQKMGVWYGAYLKDSELYEDVDFVVPVPLHVRKLIKRGYNQSEYIAKGIASELRVRVDSKSVVRSRNNKSQALSYKNDRWKNVSGVFSVKDSKALENRHILLVDDVFTTGATIITCAEEILKIVPSCRISIAVLAHSAHELGGMK